MPEFDSDEHKAAHLAALERERDGVRARDPRHPRVSLIESEMVRLGGQVHAEKRPRGRIGRQER